MGGVLQNITTFSCQKTNLTLVVDKVDFNIRTCFKLKINDISRRVPAGKVLSVQCYIN